jgi:hypothetical protein
MSPPAPLLYCQPDLAPNFGDVSPGLEGGFRLNLPDFRSYALMGIHLLLTVAARV